VIAPLAAGVIIVVAAVLLLRVALRLGAQAASEDPVPHCPGRMTASAAMLGWFVGRILHVRTGPTNEPMPNSTRRTIAARLTGAVLVASLIGLSCSSAADAGSRSAHRVETKAGSARCPSHPAEVHRIAGWLHTCGTTIVDSHNHLVRLTGISVGSMGAGTGQEVPYFSPCDGWSRPPDFAVKDIASWGFNSVELSIAWADLEPTAPTRNSEGTLVHHYNSQYLDALDDVIQSFHTHGVAVVLLMEAYLWSPAFQDVELPNGLVQCSGKGMPAWLYPNGGGLAQIVQAEKSFFQNAGDVQAWFSSAWKTVAKRYAKNRAVVGADILNEPYETLTVTWPGARKILPKSLDLVSFYDRVGKAIHSVNPHVLLLFQEQRSRRTHLWGLTRKPELTNDVLNTHFYANNWKPDGLARMQEAYGRASGWNLPTHVGEFTAFNYTNSGGFGPSPNWKANTRKMLAWCKARHIGWFIFSYGPGGFQTPDDLRHPKPGLLPVLQGGF
jgi:hypothetical protein